MTQTSVAKYINSQNGSKLLGVIHGRIANTSKMLEVRRTETANAGYVPPNGSLLLGIEVTEHVLSLLGGVCEGHNNEVQNLLRAQPNTATASANVLMDCIDLLAVMCSVVENLDTLGHHELGLISKCLDTIIEAVQGPCRGNQELVADSAAILSVNNILASDLSAHLIPREERIICKCKAVLLVHACLETRSGGAGNHKVHKDIGASLEPRNVDRFFHSARLYIESESNGADRALTQGHHGIIHNQFEGGRVDGESKNEDGEEESIKDEVLAALVVLNMVAKELDTVPDFAEQARPDHDAEGQNDFLDEYVGYVEVCWDNRIQQVSFPIPLYANYFKQSSRDMFLNTVDLDGPEKRMKQVRHLTSHIHPTDHQHPPRNFEGKKNIVHKRRPPHSRALCLWLSAPPLRRSRSRSRSCSRSRSRLLASAYPTACQGEPRHDLRDEVR